MKLMLVPELIGRQSSWFRLSTNQYSVITRGNGTNMLALVMITPVELPTLKASVLCPREVPAELSMVSLVNSDGQVRSAIDAHQLNGGVLEAKAGNRRRRHAMSIKELWLCLTSELHRR